MRIFNNKFKLSFNTVVFYLLTRIQLTIFYMLLFLLKNKNVLRHKHTRLLFILLYIKRRDFYFHFININ